MGCVVDAYALVAALVGEPARAVVEPLLATAAVSAPNLAEVLDVCVRVHDNEDGVVRERIRWLTAGGLEVVPLDGALALAAGTVRARRYRRRSCEVSLGDCFAAALAQARGAPLATADPQLASVAWAEGVEVIPLPDTRGRRPRRN
jgi:PIN domain nuclease of toxin-antitoxin system